MHPSEKHNNMSDDTGFVSWLGNKASRVGGVANSVSEAVSEAAKAHAKARREADIKRSQRLHERVAAARKALERASDNEQEKVLALNAAKERAKVMAAKESQKEATDSMHPEQERAVREAMELYRGGDVIGKVTSLRWVESIANFPACDSKRPGAKNHLYNRLLGAQRLASVLMWPELPNRGLLLAHPVGTGKTCTFVAILNSFVEALRLGRSPRLGRSTIDHPINRAYIIVPKATIINDFHEEISNKCGSKEVTEAYREDKRANPKLTRTIRLRVGERTFHVTFVVLTQQTGVPNTFENSLVMFDEAHNMVNPKNTNSDGMANAFMIRAKLLKARNCKVVIATATPVEEHPSELAILNVIKPRDSRGHVVNPFPDEMLGPDGSVSEGRAGVIQRSDLTSPSDTSEENQKKIERLKNARIKLWNEEFENEKQNVMIDAVMRRSAGLVSFVDAQRHGAGDTYPRVRVSVDAFKSLSKPKDIAEFEKHLALNHAGRLPAIDSVIVADGRKKPLEGGPGHFPWNGNRGKPTAKAFAFAKQAWSLANEGLELTDASTGSSSVEKANKQVVYAQMPASFGYLAMAVEQHAKNVSGVTPKFIWLDDVCDWLAKCERTKLAECVNDWIKDQKKWNVKRAWAVSVARQNTKHTESALFRAASMLESAYNHPENVNGEVIHAIFIDKRSAEGKSYKQSTHMHIVDVPTRSKGSSGENWTTNRGMRAQVLGRVSRLRSHCDLPPEQRYVRYFMYATSFASGKSNEMKALKDSAKNGEADVTLEALMKSAVDSELYEKKTDTMQYRKSGGTRTGFCVNAAAEGPEKLSRQLFDAATCAGGKTLSLSKYGVREPADAASCRGSVDGMVYIPAHEQEKWSDAQEEKFFEELMRLREEMPCSPADTHRVGRARMILARMFNATNIRPVKNGYVFETGVPDVLSQDIQDYARYAGRLLYDGANSEFTKRTIDAATSAGKQVLGAAKSGALASGRMLYDGANSDFAKRTMTSAVSAGGSALGAAKSGVVTTGKRFYELMSGSFNPMSDVEEKEGAVESTAGWKKWSARLGVQNLPGIGQTRTRETNTGITTLYVSDRVLSKGYVQPFHADWPHELDDVETLHLFWRQKGVISKHGEVMRLIEYPQDLRPQGTEESAKLPLWVGDTKELPEVQELGGELLRPQLSVETKLSQMAAAGHTPYTSMFGAWAKAKYDWARSGQPPMESWQGASFPERQHALFVMGMQRAALRKEPTNDALCALMMELQEAKLHARRVQESVPDDVSRAMALED